MTNPLVPTSLSNLRRFYTAPHVGYIMDSVACGHTIADGFADNPDRPSTCLVWDRGHNAYLADGDGQPRRDRAVEYLRDTLFTEDVRRRLGVAKLHFGTQGWQAALQAGLPPTSCRVLKRQLFRHPLSPPPPIPQTDPAFRILPITEVVLHDSRIENIQGLIDEICQMWGDIGRFLKSGFGYCATDDAVLTSWCTTEYMSPRYCGIGVETAEAYRRRGLSTACASAVLSQCATRGLIPYWDSWSHNTSSVKTAETLRFDLVEEYECMFVTFFP